MALYIDFIAFDFARYKTCVCVPVLIQINLRIQQEHWLCTSPRVDFHLRVLRF